WFLTIDMTVCVSCDDTNPTKTHQLTVHAPLPNSRRHATPVGADHLRDAIPDDPVRTDIRPSERLPRHGFDGEAPQLGHVHRILRLPSVASRPTAAAGMPHRAARW